MPGGTCKHQREGGALTGRARHLHLAVNIVNQLFDDNQTDAGIVGTGDLGVEPMAGLKQGADLFAAQTPTGATGRNRHLLAVSADAGHHFTLQPVVFDRIRQQVHHTRKRLPPVAERFKAFLLADAETLIASS